MFSNPKGGLLFLLLKETSEKDGIYKPNQTHFNILFNHRHLLAMRNSVDFMEKISVSIKNL